MSGCLWDRGNAYLILVNTGLFIKMRLCTPPAGIFNKPNFYFRKRDECGGVHFLVVAQQMSNHLFFLAFGCGKPLGKLDCKEDECWCWKRINLWSMSPINEMDVLLSKETIFSGN